MANVGTLAIMDGREIKSSGRCLKRSRLVEVDGSKAPNDRFRVFPASRLQTGFDARLSEKAFTVPASFARHLRKKKTSRAVALDDNAIAADLDFISGIDRYRFGQHRDTDAYSRELFRFDAREPGIARRGSDNRARGRLVEIDVGKEVANASP